MKVADKVFVVTGAGSGMGRELSLQLLAKKACVAAIDLDPRSLAETAALAGSRGTNLLTITQDITDRNGVADLPRRVCAQFGHVDGVINNAGIIQPFVKVVDLRHEAIERVFNVNLYGTLYMVKAFLPHLMGRPEAHLVNISSMGGFVPVPGQVVYGASKAAVKLLTEGLASELAHTSVRVSVVFPGAVETKISTNSGVSLVGDKHGAAPKYKMLAASAAAEIIVAGIEANRPRILVGADAKFMDFFSRLRPVGAARLIQKQMAALLGS